MQVSGCLHEGHCSKYVNMIEHVLVGVHVTSCFQRALQSFALARGFTNSGHGDWLSFQVPALVRCKDLRATLTSIWIDVPAGLLKPSTVKLGPS